jgi:predicted ATPase
MLQLEPSALRQPDEFTASSHLDSNGRHLPANLNRLALRGDAARVYTEVANRLSELIGTVKRVRIDRDDKRETLTLMLTSKDGTELPARALSDGTLRFLAYTILELDPETPGVLCMEEPENGIHPDRIPAMVQLLQDIAVDPQEPPDETNPLRQVIVNTHSPSVVMAVPEESILLAKSAPALSGNDHYSKAVFACIPGNWRNKGRERIVEMTRGEMLGYLNPAAVILNQPNSPSRRRIIDSPHQSTFFDHLQVK